MLSTFYYFQSNPPTILGSGSDEDTDADWERLKDCVAHCHPAMGTGLGSDAKAFPRSLLMRQTASGKVPTRKVQQDEAFSHHETHLFRPVPGPLSKDRPLCPINSALCGFPQGDLSGEILRTTPLTVAVVCMFGKLLFSVDVAQTVS